MIIQSIWHLRKHLEADSFFGFVSIFFGQWGIDEKHETILYIYIILILICLYYMLDWSPFPVNSGQMKVEPGSPPGPKTIATEPKKCQNPGGVGLTRGRGDNPKLFRMGFKLSLLRITRMLLERWNSGRNGQLRLHPDLGIRKVCFLGSTL